MPATAIPHFDVARKTDAVRLLNANHYIGAQCADPTFTCVWRRDGGLFGNHGETCAAALFAPPASFAWGKTAIELTRLVRAEFNMPPLTMFLRNCFQFLRAQRRYTFVLAYADPSVGHHGGIYQAGNWLYVGKSSRKTVYVHRETGQRASQRSFDQSNYDVREWAKVATGNKHTYIYPLTRLARRQWLEKSQPYPKDSDSAAPPEAL